VTRAELARLLDHSVLKPEATIDDVMSGAEVVRTWNIAFYCVQPCWARRAFNALGDTAARVVAVVGFPHGCDRTDVKSQAAALAVSDGASEIDMVMNVGALRSGDSLLAGNDIDAVVRAAEGAPVKVILETAALTDEQKRLACRLAIDAGAAFVKTSTGFHPSGGATIADVRLLRECAGTRLGVKASGGIRTLADTRAMLEAGASRIGTSSSAAILGAVDE
jgi:deoxyribose-phosphate aldolase